MSAQGVRTLPVGNRRATFRSEYQRRLRVESLEERVVLSGQPVLDAAEPMSAEASDIAVAAGLPDDYGDDAASANPINILASVSGNIDVSFDGDWFSFNAVRGTEYRFETILRGGLSDSILRLIGTDGVTELAFDDDGGPGLASLIVWSAPTSGTYYIVVGGFDDIVGTYTLRSSAADEYGNEAAAAWQTSDPASHFGLIGQNGDVDWFTFHAKQGVTYRFETQLTSLPDSVLRLFDRDGVTPLVSDDDGGVGRASLIEWTAPKDSFYFLEVRAFSNEQLGGYELTILGDDDFGESTTDAQLIAARFNGQGVINDPADTDWFSFRAVAGVQYQFTAALGSLSDSLLRIVAPDGFTEIAFDDDSGDGLGSFIEWLASSDEVYYIEVRGFGFRTGSYELTLSATDDYGNQAVDATATSDPSAHFGILEQIGDRDWFSFYALHGVQYRFEVMVDNLPNSVLRIYGSDGVTQIAIDDDGGINFGSLLEWTAPKEGTYYVEVAGFDPSIVGRYSLHINADDDHGDVAQFATFANLPESLGGVIERAGDSDWFVFLGFEGANYRFETTLGSLGDSVLRLVGFDGTEIATDDDGGPELASLIEWSPPSTDIFYLEVRGFGAGTGSYDLSLSVVDDHGNNPAEATPLTLPSTRTGSIDYFGDLDWFSVNVVQGRLYRFETSLTSLEDSVITVFGTNGTTSLAFDDDGGPGLASLILWTATTTGTVYVAVGSFGDFGTGAYSLTVAPVGRAIADYNLDGLVDQSDYVAWRSSFGQAVAVAGDGADGNGDGMIDLADYAIWRSSVTRVAALQAPPDDAVVKAPRTGPAPAVSRPVAVQNGASRNEKTSLTSVRPEWPLERAPRSGPLSPADDAVAGQAAAFESFGEGADGSLLIALAYPLAEDDAIDEALAGMAESQSAVVGDSTAMFATEDDWTLAIGP